MSRSDSKIPEPGNTINDIKADTRKPLNVQPELVELIQSAIQDVSYGEISIIIQDHRVVQINRTEKTRLRSSYPT